MGIETLILTALSAFFPVVIDGAKMGLSKLFGFATAEPKTFDETVQLEKLNIEKIKALADLDRPVGEISRWVANLRASARYFAVLGIIGVALVYSFIPAVNQIPETRDFLRALCSAALFFLLGDRVLINLKKK